MVVIKVFVVNCVGDFGFVLGIFVLFMLIDSINFNVIFVFGLMLVEIIVWFFWIDWNVVNLIVFLLFVGVMGKLV